MIIDGEGDAMPEATLQVSCDAGAPAYRVFDEERRDDCRHGRHRDERARDVRGAGGACEIAAHRGKRHARRDSVADVHGAAVGDARLARHYDRDRRVELDDLMLAAATFETQLQSVVDTIARLDGEVSPAAQSAFDLVREYLEEMVAEGAAWRVLPVGFEEEEWDVMSLVLGSVLSSIGIVLEARLGSRAEELTPIVTDLMEMRGANDDARVILDPTHMTTS
ncbi:hypothetical protein [Sandaracinus amylolyticus]|uniref:Uncharacterized protein n=1 Tax=Sandaracinus amylolyticus TaxID=927083 RepID=A0A0F6YKT5_9BACT|nr:hypothetical protein [Sandaracinus amylolyticus]AKF09563.1 hypothetical protein DB32_006712 [Sandaracinus amylolyticus]